MFSIVLIISCFNQTFFTGPFESSLLCLLWPMVVSITECGYDGGDCDDTKQSGLISALGCVNA